MKQKLIRVELVNHQTIGAQCGYGEGRTLAEAQQNALLRLTEKQRETASISTGGYQIWFSGGINR